MVAPRVGVSMDSNLAAFAGAGLALVPIPPINGRPTKAPRAKGWNQPRAEDNPNGYSANLDDFRNTSGFNFGLYHGASNTLALDLDDLELARKVFEELTDFQLLAWLESEHRAEVKSPKPNRGKLLFRLPAGFADAQLRQLKHGAHVVFELRSGNCQDVIIGEHPDGGAYRFIGNPAAIPDAPAVLLDMLQHWDAWRPCFDSALGIEPEPPRIAPRQPQRAERLPGRRDPIQEFNQSFPVAGILTRNGYRQKGRDRFIRPGSESKAPGVVIMRNCADGIERIYSHGGDVLNDGFAHDAFDCFRLLECGGDFAAALNWNAEITKHNQRLHMQERAGNVTGALQNDAVTVPTPGRHDTSTVPAADKHQTSPVSAADKCFPGTGLGESPQGGAKAEPRAIVGLMGWDACRRFAGAPPERQWLVEGVILKGKAALLAAAGGVGKSFLLLELAYKAATFRPGTLNGNFTAFGKLAHGGAAVMICAEDDAIEIHNRLTAFGPLPQPNRLIIVPLPDAGGAQALFELNPSTRAPATAQAFENLKRQLVEIPELALVVLDPLQALCGGLDLNLPQHGQHVCSALAAMAADTGAAVIVSHHLRKGGAIQNPDDARDAIRGSGGLVDGVRSALAVWPDNTDEAKSICRRLAIDWERNKVCRMAVVKANFKADLHVKTLVRGDDGLLVDRGFDLYTVTPKQQEVYDKLANEIEAAAANGKPFTRTGQNGVYERRHELTPYFHGWGRQTLQDAVQDLLNAGVLGTFKLPNSRAGAVWLGRKIGVLSQSMGGDFGPLTVPVPTIPTGTVKPGTVEIQE